MATVHDILADPVTSHMRTDPTCLRMGQTVSEALDYVRKHPPSGRVVYFYVTDADDHLKGVVPTRRLLLADPSTQVDELMVKSVIAVPITATVLEACEFFTMYKLLAFPVVDFERRVVGQVDVDLYTDELSDIERREGNDNLFQLIGVHLTESEQKRPILAFRRRFPWLLANITGGMLAALLADAYDDVARLATVTPFIPMVLALAESVSIQSVSLALQTIHGQPTWTELFRKMFKELGVGVMLGLGCGVLVGMIALLWKGQMDAALSLLLGVAGGVSGAAGVGVSLPYLLKLFRRDPQVASGPIALAASDMLTLILYFNLGRWILL